jgi:hypothetical protein
LLISGASTELVLIFFACHPIWLIFRDSMKDHSWMKVVESQPTPTQMSDFELL